MRLERHDVSGSCAATNDQVDIQSTATFAEMARLFALGYSLIPLGGPDGKKPLVANWPKSRLPLATCISRMKAANSATYGIRLSGLTVVDCDSDNAETHALVAERFGRSNVAVRSARGQHHYFRSLGSKPAAIRLSEIAIDFKSGPAEFVVGPGSVRPDGTVYAVVNGQLGDPADLPEIFPVPLYAKGRKARIPKGGRNHALWRRARELAPCSESEDEIFHDLIGFRDLECDDPNSVSTAEVRGIAIWAWKLRLENRVWDGDNSTMQINRLALTRLAAEQDGPDALMLYSVLVSKHGHIPGKQFAIVPDAMKLAGLLPFDRKRGYRARKTLLRTGLILPTRKGRMKVPDLFRLSNPAVTEPREGEGRGGRV